jgi:hypothetical protein
MRHGQHRHGVLTFEGKREIVAVARTLAETLVEQGLSLGRICWTSAGRLSSPEAAATAIVLCEAVRRALTRLHQKPSDHCVDTVRHLGPTLPGPYDRPAQAREQLRHVQKALQEATSDAGIVVLIGNDPALGWLAGRLVGHPVPMNHAEMVYAAPHGRRRRFRWSISPSDEKSILLLEAKIRSKMDVAKVFGGVIIGVFTFLVESLYDDGVRSPLAAAALLTLGAAAAMFIATLFFYDRLLMPRRFWGQRLSRFNRRVAWLPERPPSSASWVLYANMIRIWRGVFLAAAVLVGIGLGLVGASSFERAGLEEPIELWPWPTLGLVATIVLTGAWIRFFRPRLGVQD